MRKKLMILAITALLALCSFSFMACNNSEAENITIKLDKNVISLDRYETATLVATVTGSEKAVTWESSNTAIASVDGGKITVLSAGTANIIAKIGDVSDTCVLTATDSGEVPILRLSHSDVELIDGANLNVTSTVKYKYKDVQASLEWKSSDTAVATVDASGKITAVAKGEAVITIKGSYNGFALSETISVKVKENAEIRLNKTESRIGASATEADANTDNITAEFYVKGEKVAETQFTWTSADPAIATVVGGVITGVSEGEVRITASCVSAKGSEFSAYVSVEVYVPIVEKNIEKVLDLSQETINFDISGMDIPNTATITKIVDATDSSLPLQISSSAGLALDKTSLESLELGSRIFIVYTQQLAYKVKGLIASKVLSTPEDFDAIETKGYYVFGNDIDFTGKAFTNRGDPSGDFYGTLDGRGFAIKNYTVTNAKLFWFIKTGAVIKNIAFYNMKLGTPTEKMVGTGVFAEVLDGGSRMENIFIMGDYNPGNDGNWNGAASMLVKKSWGGIINNCVAIVTSSAKNDTKWQGVFCGGAPVNSVANITNCYAIGTNSVVAYAEGDGHELGSFVTTDTVKAFADMDAFKAGVTNLSSFNADVWDISTGVPMFKRYKELPITITNTNTNVFSGQQMKALTDADVVRFSLGAGTDSNITINATTGVITVSSSLTAEKKFTVNATNIYNNKTTSKEFTAKPAVLSTVTAKAIELDLGVAENFLTIDTAYVTDIGIIDSVYDDAWGTLTLTEKPTTAGSVKVSKEAIKALGVGAHSIIVMGESGKYIIIPAKIFTKILKTAEDFNAITTTGHYVFGNDIDFTGKAFTSRGDFSGTLDGRGFAIKNYTVTDSKLFFFILSGAVIKNIAFYNIKLGTPTEKMVGTGILGEVLHGGATMENIFITGDYNPGNDGWWNGAASVLVKKSWGGTINNCVAIVTSSATDATKWQGIICGGVPVNSVAKITNCYAIGTNSVVTYGEGEGHEPGSFVTTDTIKAFADETAFKAGVTNLSSFSADVWDTSSGVPVFKGYKKT